MNQELKKALAAARANLDNIKRQHTAANANKDIIFARSTGLNQRLKAAADRLEVAQIQLLRGIVGESVVSLARSHYQVVRDEHARQVEDEETSTRAVNMSHEHGNAVEALGIARSAYFADISEHIKKPLCGDGKLRKLLLSLDAANSCMHGCAPSEPGSFDRRTWVELLVSIFPIPTNEEEQRAYAEFVRAHDGE